MDVPTVSRELRAEGYSLTGGPRELSLKSTGEGTWIDGGLYV